MVNRQKKNNGQIVLGSGELRGFKMLGAQRAVQEVCPAAVKVSGVSVGSVTSKLFSSGRPAGKRR